MLFSSTEQLDTERARERFEIEVIEAC